VTELVSRSVALATAEAEAHDSAVHATVETTSGAAVEASAPVAEAAAPVEAEAAAPVAEVETNA
jgi:hypothetical protein